MQDAGVRHVRVRLALVLTFLRSLAGRRGWAHVTWHGQGFTYTIFAVRDPLGNTAVVTVDDDTSGEGIGAEDTTPLRKRLAELLGIQP